MGSLSEDILSRGDMEVVRNRAKAEAYFQLRVELMGIVGDCKEGSKYSMAQFVRNWCVEKEVNLNGSVLTFGEVKS